MPIYTWLASWARRCHNLCHLHNAVGNRVPWMLREPQEVYGHSATVVGNTVWVLGGKNQAGKRISVSLGTAPERQFSLRSLGVKTKHKLNANGLLYVVVCIWMCMCLRLRVCIWTIMYAAVLTFIQSEGEGVVVRKPLLGRVTTTPYALAANICACS